MSNPTLQEKIALLPKELTKDKAARLSEMVNSSDFLFIVQLAKKKAELSIHAGLEPHTLNHSLSVNHGVDLFFRAMCSMTISEPIREEEDFGF